MFPSKFSYFHMLFCNYVTFYRLGVQPRETPGKSYILELQVLEAYRLFLTGPSHILGNFKNWKWKTSCSQPELLVNKALHSKKVSGWLCVSWFFFSALKIARRPGPNEYSAFPEDAERKSECSKRRQAMQELCQGGSPAASRLKIIITQ